ncbi:MAG: hypothetical protein JWP01_876 [Myxococcales bacterium]|nr:hypothetical protein [Myxococcales bacterium]
MTGELCQFGACDKNGPAGRIRFSNVRFFVADGARSETRFDIAYEGALARCRQSPDRGQPFACSISETGGEAYELTLTEGCTMGTVAPRAPGRRPMVLQTDTVEIAGQVFPSREVALLDDTGVLAHVDVKADDNLDVYTRAGTPLSHPLLLALVGLHAFLQLEGTPPECMRST